MVYVQFSSLLRQLGKSDKERGRVLGIDEDTAKRYRNGELPKIIAALSREPALLRALADDAEALHAADIDPASTAKPTN